MDIMKSVQDGLGCCGFIYLLCAFQTNPPQPVLAEMFELGQNSVHAVVSKMIITEELMASLDQPSQCVMMHRSEPSRLQSIALQLSDKVGHTLQSLSTPSGPF